MRFIGIIPARYASTRFPGKPLAMMKGKTVIERVYAQALNVLDTVYVATDDSRIYDAVIAFGGKAVYTSEKHKSGTDRVYEAYTHISDGEDVIINIQGDEPFIHESQIRELMNCFNDSDAQIATLVRKWKPEEGIEAIANPNSPKVVFDKNNFALYFSRSIIPYVRGTETKEWNKYTSFYKHLGMYGYRASVLKEITSLPQSSLEIAESLEQLRWLQNGYKIKIGFTDIETVGIDTPADLEHAISLLK